VGISGTGGGFKKFGNGETDISDASHPIKKSEADAARSHAINYIELPVAFDALSVVVNPRNTWCKSITTAELKKIWQPEAQGKVTRWSQVRAGWPNRPIRLFGPGSDSGTFDYFTDAINGKEKATRGDYTPSEDDNVLVQGVARDMNAMGYFGVAYYEENRSRLRAVAIDDGNPNNGRGPILPSMKTVLDGTYQPLARPIFIYVSSKSMNRPEVKAFVDFYLSNAAKLTREVGYIPLPATIYRKAQSRFAKRTMGSVFKEGGSVVGVKLGDVL
jgi:phosphate transport system substrate-binding protein